MTLYYGTHENIIVDAMKFEQKALEQGVELDMRIWENMNYVFPIYPIPEAAKAQREIVELVKH